MGQQRVANELRKEGLMISPAGGVLCVDEPSMANLLSVLKGPGEKERA